MFSKALRVFRAVHRCVVGGESWSSAWEAIKGEIGGDLPTLAGYVGAGLTVIGTLAGDVSWAGIVVLTFCAFVAARQFVVQQRTPQQSSGPIVEDGQPSLPAPPSATPPEQSPNVETAEERQAKHVLAAFVADRLLPACEAQRALQNAVIKRLSKGNSLIEDLARRGRETVGPVPNFIEARKRLAHYVQNVSAASLAGLMQAVHAIENELYSGYCSFSIAQIKRYGLNFDEDDELRNLYERWRLLNIELERDYEPFRRDPRFPALTDLSPKRLGRGFRAEYLP